MVAKMLDGQAAAESIRQQLRQRIERLREAGVTPGLGTLLVGDDGPSHLYVSMKHRDAADLGLYSVEVQLDAQASSIDVRSQIEQLNSNESIHAFIVQYPFPEGLDYNAHIDEVDPAKDADGLHPVNLGRLVMGDEAPLACTPAGIVELLRFHGIDLAGKHVAIIGRGMTIGRPLANLLTLKRAGCNAAVSVVHTGFADLASITRTADVVVSAAGQPDLVTPDMIRPGAVVVAAGVSFVDGKACSDVRDDVAEVAGWLSPRIGGVGPMTRIMLFANTIAAAEKLAGVS